jgi:hypothetical protein
MGTEARGASNAKAKRELGWTLRYPSWRQGFPQVYAAHEPAVARSERLPRPALPSGALEHGTDTNRGA